MSWLFARPLRPFVVLAGLASLFLNVVLLMPAIYMMQVFDRVFASRSVETLVMLAMLTLLFLALGACMDTVRVRALAWAGRWVERRLAPEALRNALTLRSAGSTDESPSADALRDVTQLRALLSGPGIIALFDAPWLPVYLLFIAAMHPLLGITATVGAGALVGLNVLTTLLTRDRAERAQDRSRRATRFAERLIRNAEVIGGMGMTSAAIARWLRREDESLDAQRDLVQRSSVLAALARTLRQVLQVAMLGIGAWLVIDTRASPGIMIAATILLSRALQPVEQLISGSRVLLEARAAWRRLEGYAVAAAPTSTLQLPAPQGRIDMERVVYSFAPDRAPFIRNLSLSLRAGESLGISGPSGSGKTTLVRLLLGLWRPQSGSVRLDGADLSQWDRDAFGRYVGYLPQDVELFAGTVADNIARFDDRAEAPEQIIHASQLANAHDMILTLPHGYNTPVGEAGAALSGGQRQRIALARALYGEPRLLLLDEPNASLDAAGEAALLATLAELKTRGVTTIVVSHSPRFTAAVDKLLVLKNGALDVFGPSAAVIARLNTGSTAPRVVPISAARNVETLA